MTRQRKSAGAALVVFGVLCAISGSGSLEAQTKFRILASGGFHGSTTSFGNVSTFTEFLEQARLSRNYSSNTGPVFEFGGIYSITSNFGIMGSFELFNGDNDSAFERVLPHPLLFNQDRVVSGDVPGLSYSERAVHLDAVFTQDSGSFTVDVFGGPTLFFTKTELLDRVNTSSSYPFDQASLVGTDAVELDDNPIGFNVGAALTYKVNQTFGIAFQARFSRATVSAAQNDGSTVEFDAGGFRAGAGIRLAF